MGEYISLGKIESALKLCSLVENVCVYGDSNESYCVALIIGQRNAIEQLAQKNGITGKSYEELCDNPTITKKVLETIAVFGKQGKDNLI